MKEVFGFLSTIIFMIAAILNEYLFRIAVLILLSLITFMLVQSLS